MNNAFKVRLSADEFDAGLSALQHELAACAGTGQQLMRIQLPATILAGLIVVTIWPASFKPVLVAAMIYAVGQSIALRVAGKGLQSPSYDEGNSAEMRVRFWPAGFTDTSVFRARRWRWSSLLAIRHCEHVTVLILAGWDMLILPHRLWNSDDARNEFFARVRNWAGLPEENTRSTPARTVDQVIPWPTIGGIAAGVLADLIVFPWLISAAAPLLIGGQSIPVVLAAIVIGFVIGYLVYRLVKFGIEQLSPSRRASAAKGLAYIFPAYMLAAWMGWL